MSKVLSIDLDKEYRLKIESASEIQNSFFKDVYKQAFEQVLNIVKWSEVSKTEQKSRTTENKTFEREFREYNNIIAFTGERGTGKSSAMITVANNLVASNSQKITLESDGTGELNFKTKFESLHTIDPSKFEKHQNIIEVILAELFDSFNTQIKDRTYQFNENEKREVLKAFQDVYKCLKIVSSTDQSKKYEGDALETLAGLADATKLEKNLQDLISKYLKFIHPDNAEKSSTLIIPIDDFDLNVRAAGQMAEQIRKYLMIPQVIVLMAINIEQFGDVKTQDVIGDFQTLFSRSNMSESPRDVAARYILKLIPIERRILIPNIKVERNDVVLELIKNGVTLIEKSETDKFEERIFDFIFSHTDLLFVSKKEEYHTFLPDTLRELQTLFSVLGSFETIVELIKSKEGQSLSDETKEENRKIELANWEKKQANLIKFSNYFKNTWIKDYLLTPFVKMIFESSSLDTISWNKYFVTSTIEILTKEENFKNDWVGTEKINLNDIEFDNIIDRTNYYSNVSLGDLLYFFQTLKRIYLNNRDVKKLIFAINCLYSITLNSLNFNRKLLIEVNDDFEIDKENLLQELKNIVNGTIVNHKMNLIRNRRDQQSRLQFPLNYNNISTENELLTHNIFIKYQFSTYYRKNDKIVFRDVFKNKDRFKYPTFNWFSFVCKDDTNFFPLPFNNLEYWSHIIESVDKDSIKEQLGGDSELVINLFMQIYSKLDVDSLKDNYRNSSVLKLIYDPQNSESIGINNTKIQEIFDSIYDQQQKVLNYLEKTISENASRKRSNIIAGLTRNQLDKEIIERISTLHLSKYKSEDVVTVSDIRLIMEFISSIGSNE